MISLRDFLKISSVRSASHSTHATNNRNAVGLAPAATQTTSTGFNPHPAAHPVLIILVTQLNPLRKLKFNNFPILFARKRISLFLPENFS